jgi:MinD superfamily P-loop ATPase
MPGTIVTIAQQKGGAGKTTLAIHLALAWAAGDKRVAIVDIDPQASLSTGSDCVMSGSAQAERRSKRSPFRAGVWPMRSSARRASTTSC